MKNPKIRIESDGKIARVYLDGAEVASCTHIEFYADSTDGIHISWNGIFSKQDENGKMLIENDEIVTEEFYYDNKEAVTQCEH